MPRTSVTLFNKVLIAIEQLEQQLPSLPISFLENLMSRYNENSGEDWINWIINTNNTLFHHYIDEQSLHWLRPLHELLANLLLDYDALKNNHSPVMAFSPYMRDCLLTKHYGFHSFPLIRKYIKATENMPMFKDGYYKNDPVFSDSFSPPFESSAQARSPDSPTVLTHSTYVNDPYFQLIVAYYGKPYARDTKFAGISTAKGGIYNVLHIILDQGAHVRFFGGLTPSMNTESAYTHGPIFMTTSHLQRTPNTDLYAIHISNLLFIIPHDEMRETLKQLLYRARTHGLISTEEIEPILNNQVFTYREYWASHCQLKIIVEPAEEVGMGTRQETDDTRMSELIDGSPLQSFRASSFGKHTFFEAQPMTPVANPTPKRDKVPGFEL